MNVYLESVELWEFASCYRNYKVCRSSELLRGDTGREGGGRRAGGAGTRVVLTALRCTGKCMLSVPSETR